MSNEDWRCLTCGHEGPPAEIVCGHFRRCPNYARRQAAGTLPPNHADYEREAPR